MSVKWLISCFLVGFIELGVPSAPMATLSNGERPPLSNPSTLATICTWITLLEGLKEPHPAASPQGAHAIAAAAVAVEALAAGKAPGMLDWRTTRTNGSDPDTLWGEVGFSSGGTMGCVTLGPRALKSLGIPSMEMFGPTPEMFCRRQPAGLAVLVNEGWHLAEGSASDVLCASASLPPELWGGLPPSIPPDVEQELVALWIACDQMESNLASLGILLNGCLQQSVPFNDSAATLNALDFLKGVSDADAQRGSQALDNLASALTPLSSSGDLAAQAILGHAQEMLSDMEIKQQIFNSVAEEVAGSC